MQRNSINSKAVLLQVDGKHFDRISEAPGKLEAEYNLTHWTNNDARISYETYVQEFEKDIKEGMSEFLCHSTVVRDKQRNTEPLKEGVR